MFCLNYLIIKKKSFVLVSQLKHFDNEQSKRIELDRKEKQEKERDNFLNISEKMLIIDELPKI